MNRFIRLVAVAAMFGCGAGTRPVADDDEVDGDADADSDADTDSDADADGDCDENTTTGATFEAEILGLAFAPAEIEIAPGTRVHWTNWDAVAHTVTEGTPGAESHLWDSGLLEAGQIFERTFCDVGEWAYFSSTHPNVMRDAVVRVR